MAEADSREALDSRTALGVRTEFRIPPGLQLPARRPDNYAADRDAAEISLSLPEIRDSARGNRRFLARAG